MIDIQKKIRQHINARQAEQCLRFFKTGKGDYGHGDKFLGIKVPLLRRLARQNKNLSFVDIETLLKSEYHEERLLGAFILILQFKVGNELDQKKIYKLYLKNWRAFNNWDLVDTTTPNIVGEFLVNNKRQLLYRFAKSKNLWKRRMSILATLSFIRRNQFTDTLTISQQLLLDKHDLIHKAVGWMLREVGKRNMAVEETFLKKYAKLMPRTMLRYAIERFPEAKRKKYLKVNT